jgi:hypothetical protein
MTDDHRPRAVRETTGIPEAVRTAVDERDGKHCRVCGKYLGERRALHHIVYGGDDRGMGGRRIHNVEEILTVCWLPGDPGPGLRPCHDTVHASKRRWQPVLLEVARQRGITAIQLERWKRRRADTR